MGQIIGPGSSRNSDYSPRNRRSLFGASIIRQYGFRGVVALVVAAMLAFAPLALLLWFNLARLTSVVVSQHGQAVVIKPARHEQEKDDDEPGETALLQVTCEIPTIDGWRELLCDDDPARRNTNFSDSSYVRTERVYLRKAGDRNVPFGLLGKPPVSVWLPAGDYELAVVHDAPRSEQRIDARSYGFPLVTVLDSCSLPAKKKTVRRIRLPHYDWGDAAPIPPAGQSGDARLPTADELQPLADAIARLTPIPTPGGYLLALAEPLVLHSEDHRHCTADFKALEVVPREWNRDQIATLRNWLPDGSSPARDKLSKLIDALSWREMFEGWFCYALAGVAGLVFTRWGALVILEPNRRRATFGKSLKRCVVVFLVCGLAWFLLQFYLDGGFRGYLPLHPR
jgi:hypothetical protein